MRIVTRPLWSRLSEWLSVSAELILLPFLQGLVYQTAFHLCRVRLLQYE